MSFGENLQYLRKTYDMTQEALAERMEVSRQTVSRWESDSVFPEMDKVVRLCDLFHVNMDDLLRGSVEDTCANDLEAYNREYNRFSLLIALATGIVILGVAAMLFLQSRMQGESPIFMVPLFAGLIVAVAIYIVAGINHDQFLTAHPTIRGQYPAAEVKAFKRRFPVLLAAPTCFLLLSLMLLVLFGEQADAAGWGDALTAGFLACVAIVVPVFIYAGIQNGKYDLRAYNRTRGGKQPASKREQVSSGICGIIMLTATALYLVLGFLQGLWHPGWIVFPIGGIACGIVNVVMESVWGKAAQPEDTNETE